MSNPHFDNYVSPNIVIVPTVSFCGAPTKKQKSYIESQPVTQAIPVVPDQNSNQQCEAIFSIENNTKNVSIEENSSNLSSTEDTSRNDLEDSEQRVKKTLSWASNYLQSIGQSQPKVTKLANPAQQNHQLNANKNPFKWVKPTLRNLDVAQSHSNNVPQSSDSNGARNVTSTESNSTTINNNSHDTKHPIKINLLYHKQNTDPFCDKANRNNIVNQNHLKTPNFEKPYKENKADYISSSKLSHSKSLERNNMDSEKYDRGLKIQNFEKNSTDKRTDVITPSHSKSRKINNMNKEKCEKDLKNTNSMSTSKKDSSVKTYADVSKNRNEIAKERKLPAKTKNVELKKSSSKSRYKTKDGLDAWASDRIKNHSKKPSHSHCKDRLEEWASNRIKTHSEKPTLSQNNKAPSNTSRSESKKEKIKLQAKKPLKTDNGGHKTKSKPSTKYNYDDHKNNIPSKSNENHMNKACEKPQSTCIKSVVQIKNNFDLEGPFKTVPDNGHNFEDLRTKLNTENGQNIADLRAKLKRKYQHSRSTKRDNLIITVQNNDKEDINDKQPTAEEKPKSEKKTRKYKKIKLVINVVCEKCSESSESDSDNKINEEYPVANVDLSFLDDFDVDDIVDSLNDQENKANVNSPSKTKETKIVTTENLDAKPFIKKEDDKDKKCTNIHERLHETPHKTDLKQEVIAEDPKNTNIKYNNDENFRSSDIYGHEIQTASPGRNKIEKNEFDENSNTVSVKEKSNTIITSPMKLSTQQNYNRINETTNINEHFKKDLHSQNNTTGNKLTDSNIRKETNADIINMKSETQVGATDVITIDLTQIETDIPHGTEKKSTNKDILNTQLQKQVVEKLCKTRDIPRMDGIIDLTASSETTLEVKKDVNFSVINTDAQWPLAETFSNKDISAQSRQNPCKMKNDKKEDKHVSEIPLPPQDNYTKATVTENDIIDLTVQTEITSNTKNESTSSSVTIQTPKEQKHETEENINNIYSQPTETASEIKSNIEEPRGGSMGVQKNDFIDEHSGYQADKTSLNNALVENNTKGRAESNSIQRTEIAAGLQRHEINKISLNNAKMKNIAKEPVKSDIVTNAHAAETEPGSQKHEAKRDSTNNAEMKTDTKAMAIDSGIVKLQTTEIAPVLQQHKTKKTSSIGDITQATSVKDDISNAQATNTATEPHQQKGNDISSIDNNNAQSTNKVTAPQNNIVKKVIACQQAHSRIKPSSNKQEVVKTVNNTKVNDDTEDVLSITGSIDENLTSYNAEATDSDKTPIYTPTGSVKSLIVFDIKEEATTETIKSKPESKDNEKKHEGKSLTDKNKNKTDSAETEQSVLEKRMMQYFRDEKYSIESLIRHGKFSKIYLCKDGNGRNYALKVLSKGTRLTGCRIEDMLKNLQKDIPRKNYHCVFLVDGFATLDKWCFLMDFYPKNMKEVLYENGKCFHIDVAQTLARQLVSAVSILRNHNIMHLDIKPSHILMNTSNDRLKLAGFDESQYLEGLSVLPCVGTVNYRPPEVILGYPYFGKIDVWSTALVIYEMCTARQLFPGQFNNDILYKQMCTLGNIPYEMVIQSVFTNKHYRGAYFARRYGSAWQQCVLIHNFKKSTRLATSLFNAYHRDWGKLRTKSQKADDTAKLRILRDLLQEMLMLDPTRRIPIEFVYTNSLIYETFDSCV